MWQIKSYIAWLPVTFWIALDTLVRTWGISDLYHPWHEGGEHGCFCGPPVSSKAPGTESVLNKYLPND